MYVTQRKVDKKKKKKERASFLPGSMLTLMKMFIKYSQFFKIQFHY